MKRTVVSGIYTITDRDAHFDVSVDIGAGRINRYRIPTSPAARAAFASGLPDWFRWQIEHKLGEDADKRNIRRKALEKMLEHKTRRPGLLAWIVGIFAALMRWICVRNKSQYWR